MASDVSAIEIGENFQVMLQQKKVGMGRDKVIDEHAAAVIP